MYIPKSVQQTDPNELHKLIRERPLAALVVNTGSGLTANHLPLHLIQDGSSLGLLQGHIARANPLWRECPADSPVLAIFQGPDAYVSPNWYPTKQEHGKVVPTWNYVAVHAVGKIRFIDEPGWKLDFLQRLTAHHESTQQNPWSVTDAPTDFTEKMLGAIVGLEVLIDDLQGKWKASQNQPKQNRLGVVNGLAGGDGDAPAMAELMVGLTEKT